MTVANKINLEGRAIISYEIVDSPEGHSRILWSEVVNRKGKGVSGEIRIEEENANVSYTRLIIENYEREVRKIKR